ncbi:MAG: sensor histidine kinase [Rhodocyclaceae bacterium]|nr:sensor histidine kinase [Rhodocyclaceae bacterium]
MLADSRLSLADAMTPARQLRSFALRLLLILLPGVLAGGLAYRHFLDSELAQLARANEARLEFYRSSLIQTLEEFRLLPGVVGLDGRVQRLLGQPGQRDAVEAVNRYLEQVSTDPAIQFVFLLGPDGTALAASNWRDELSLVGRNYGFRPYFEDAMAGRAGRFYGIGVTTQLAGFFLSAPVTLGERTAGVAVVKISLDRLEDAWRRSGDLLMLTDRLGVALMASSPGWKFRSLRPIGREQAETLAHTQQYLFEELPPLRDADGAPLAPQPGEARVVSLAASAQPFVSAGRRGDRDYLLQASPLPDYGWQLLFFAELTDVRVPAMTAAVAVGLAALLLLTAGLLLELRRRRLQERRAARAALEKIQADLEARIAERTEALTEANRSLEQRVAALKDAEQILTHTGDSAVQAGKLAVLGQMAAGISHEINQPLAALTTLADNAATLVARGRNDEARRNLGYISELAQRMGRIVGQLKTFARRGEEQLSAVAVSDAMNNVLRLFGTRGKQPGLTIDIECRHPGLHAHADPVRLEQVLLNLVTNAADAMDQQAEGRLAIVCERDGDVVEITLRDNGPGIPPEVLPHLFEPFFTTKPAGKGLGLGLAISRLIVESLDGRLVAGNNADGGAWFRLRLPSAEPPD